MTFRFHICRPRGTLFTLNKACRCFTANKIWVAVRYWEMASLIDSGGKGGLSSPHARSSAEPYESAPLHRHCPLVSRSDTSIRLTIGRAVESKRRRITQRVIESLSHTYWPGHVYYIDASPQIAFNVEMCLGH